MSAFAASVRVVSIFELRQYTLHPGRRDELIELFEREFVESQEAVGMRVVGTFRDLGDPDRFVWIREFADMAVRKAALEGFYYGPVWKEHAHAANDTMIDSDDVLLLEPVDGGFTAGGPSRVLAVVYLDGDPGPAKAGAVVLRSSDEVNDFPALPVRADRAVVWIARFPDAEALAAARAELPPGAAQVLELEPTARSRYR